MFTEISPRQTLEKMAQDPNWIKNSSVEALTGDLMVAKAESNLEWFACYYVDKDNTLYDLERGRIVGSDGGVEEQKEFNNELEDWFLENDSGIAIGISPKGGIFHHPDNQIQIYRISYELIKTKDGKLDHMRKVLLAAFHQFDCDFRNSEEIRRFIFPTPDNEEFIIQTIEWLQKISRKKVETENKQLEKIAQAYQYVQRLKMGEDYKIVFADMERERFLGENPIGCASTGLNSLSSGELRASQTTLEGTWCNNCGACGAPINAFITPGYVCKSCNEMYLGIC